MRQLWKTNRMNKKTKRIWHKTALAMMTALVLMFAPLMMVRADTGQEYDPWYALNQELRELRRRLSELEGRPEDPAPEPTPEPVYAPNVRLLSPQNITLQAGETEDITITMRNIGTHTAFDLLTQAVPSANAPFTVEFLQNSNSIRQVTEGAQRTMTLRVTVDANASPGDHTITLTNFFRNQARANMTSPADILSVRIGGEAAAEPNVRLGGFNTAETQPLEPGQTFSVSATIQNLGTGIARDVQVSLPNMNAETIFFMGDLNQAFFQTMAAGQTNSLNFTFQTSSRIASGTYPIEFLVTYRDENGQEPLTETFTFFVNVYAPDEEETAPNLEIRGMTAPTGIVGVGETATVTFYLYNAGDAEARTVRIEAAPDNEQAIRHTTARTQLIPVLAPGESRQLSFGFSPREAASTQNYTVNFNVNFNVDGEAHRLEGIGVAAFNVYNPEDEEDEEQGRQIPRVIISYNSVYPLIPRAGQNFELTITFRNTNATRSVNNIRITLEAQPVAQPGEGGQGSVFTPVGGSNTLFIDFLPPLGEETKVLTFFAIPDALPRSYNIEVNFEYQDDDFEVLRANEILSIPVAQVTSLEPMGLNIPEFVTPGEMIMLDFRVLNTGRVNLNNVRVRTEGPFDTREAQDHIGQLRAQASFSFFGRFDAPFEEGVYEGAVIIYGEDATGDIIEYRHEFTLTVGGFGFDDMDFMFEGGGDRFPGMEGDRFPFPDDRFPMEDMEDEEESGFFGRIRGFFTREVEPTDHEWWTPEAGDFRDFGIEPDTAPRWGAILGVGGGVLAVIVIVVVVIIRKKRSRLDFDDDDDA